MIQGHNPEDAITEAVEEAMAQTDENPDVYNFNIEGFNEELERLDNIPEAYVPDQLRNEEEVSEIYGEIKDRRWVENIENDIGHEFSGGAYLIEDENHHGEERYVLFGTAQVNDGDEIKRTANYSTEAYNDLDEFIDDVVRNSIAAR